MIDRPSKILPRNLTAMAAEFVVGNPASSRPEDAVGNCYPGLEVDVRNFDRRFFPGLVFNFVARNDVGAPYTYPQIYGAKLAYIDAELDPELAAESEPAQSLRNRLGGIEGGALREGVWYIDWIEQAGVRLHMYREGLGAKGEKLPLDGLAVWRLVRSLEPKPLLLGLVRRDAPGEVMLAGWRRRFTDAKTGVISAAYQPGELTQGLCSPWQHDFRDCACNYWSSNHPDLVFVETAASNGEGTRLVQADWLRAERAPELAARAFDSLPDNRPFQLDHHQINSAWKSLSIVLGGREVDGLYIPNEMDEAEPFANPADLVAMLGGFLAPLEITLALEYLYARFTLLDPLEAQEEARRSALVTLPEDVIYLRHNLMVIAVSEMQHLRWVNILLWELNRLGHSPSYAPVLDLAAKVPSGKQKERMRALRPLLPEVLDDFIAVEAPSGTIDGAYARVIATLRNAALYPPRLLQIAERIISDGVEHEQRFIDVQRVVRSYAGIAPPPYLRTVRPGSAGEPGVAEALEHYRLIRSNLEIAYSATSLGNVAVSGQHVTSARVSMNRLLEMGDELAKRGIGIPFWT